MSNIFAERIGHRWPATAETGRAYIQVTVTQFPTGDCSESYQWIGNRRDTVIVSGRHRDKIKELPWPLKIVGEDHAWGSLECVRTDVDFGLTATVWFARRNTIALAKWVYVRLMVTAAVWGLADYDRTHFVTWHDLKIVKWLSKKGK